MPLLDHPNDEGRWTRLELSERAALWKRERETFPPVIQYYLVAPPRQHEILYDEAKALAAFQRVSGQGGVLTETGQN